MDSNHIEENQSLEITRRLLIKFLKMHGHMNLLYNNTVYNKLVSTSFIERGISCLYHMLWHEQKEYERSNCHHLALSQFWRFYVLEHIDEYPMDMKEELKKGLIWSLSINGTRKSEELEKLFKKHNILQ